MELDATFFAGVLGRGTVVRCSVSPCQSEGVGFIGTLRRATVDVEEDDGRSRTLRLVVKTPPESEPLRQVVRDLGLFARETAVYERTLPDMYSLFLHSGSKIAPHSLAPAMYPSGPIEDTLVLEDLAAAGYRHAPGGRQLDVGHCGAALRALAVFHAGSLALHEDDAEAAAGVSEPLYTERHRDYAAQFLLPNLRALAAQTRAWPGFERFADKISCLEAGVVDRAAEAVRRRDGELSVLNHGDFWVNNVLFLYDEASGAVDRAKLVDFQMCRFSSPALDLNYFLCTSADKAARGPHRDRLLEEYRGAFNNTLAALGSDTRLTREELDRQLEERAFYGLVGAFTDLATILAPQHSVSLDSLGEEGAFERLYAAPALREPMQELLLRFEEQRLL